MTEEERRMPINQPCYYCGEITTGRDLHIDHFIPKFLGGTDDLENLVYACRTCNMIKGKRSVEDARIGLMQKKLGWPKFSAQQISWMRENGFDLSAVEKGKLAYEERGVVVTICD